MVLGQNVTASYKCIKGDISISGVVSRIAGDDVVIRRENGKHIVVNRRVLS